VTSRIRTKILHGFLQREEEAQNIPLCKNITTPATYYSPVQE
jgi:hypothetical protein